MRNIAMMLGYDGSSYSGFQTQPFGNTIQDKLEEAVAILTGEKVKIHGSGRTDAGVHARGQVISFLTESQIPIERWCLALNGRLPADIRIYRAWEAPVDFHARKSAKRKTYHYTIQRSRINDIFHRHTRLHHPQPLNYEAMKEAVQALIGEHDFRSFCTVRTDKEYFVRTIYQAELTFTPEPQPGDDLAGIITFSITGSGFLYNMVRIVVGTLIQIGEGKRKAADMAAILQAQDRARAGPTAVAQGLILWSVEY